ncbi:hypothetical protein Bca52824_070184 [Brassica carinata]|uniref:Lipid desaturase domain-containing protein n=1 Tax=Brassica carinata TaxID=52824 RepID=A0A8X7Q3Y5_BRACI|nr:hypothetical protein Bca52824_070184 [Brassica carinata]
MGPAIHGTKSKLPPLVVALQDMGLLVSRKQHARHHQAPYNNNYCIVSGTWNKVLGWDRHGASQTLSGQRKRKHLQQPSIIKLYKL